MRIYFVRHGNTIENQRGIRQGQSLGTTSALGMEQNRKVAKRLKDIEFDYAFVSDLSRTMDTATQILAFHPKTKMVVMKELRERGAGIFEGQPKWEYERACREYHAAFAKFKPQGGESVVEVQQRALDAMQKILSYKAKHALVVSHGMFMSTIFLDILKKDLTYDNCEMYAMHNTGVTIVDIGREKKIKVYDSIEHLA